MENTENNPKADKANPIAMLNMTIENLRLNIDDVYSSKERLVNLRIAIDTFFSGPEVKEAPDLKAKLDSANKPPIPTTYYEAQDELMMTRTHLTNALSTLGENIQFLSETIFNHIGKP